MARAAASSRSKPNDAIGHSSFGILHSLSWHLFSLPIAADVNPVKIEGDFDRGEIILADLTSPKLALKWSPGPRKTRAADALVKTAIARVFGQATADASEELFPDDRQAWLAARVSYETEPPGRDVWVGYSARTHRILAIARPTDRRSRRIATEVVAPLSELDANSPTRWSVFDLACTVPAGFRLKSHRLNAGDLSLSFANRNATLAVRQLGPARLALDRLKLDEWLRRHALVWRKTHRAGKPENEGESRAVVTLKRRRRFAFAWWISKNRVCVATHDAARDRIVIIDADSVETAQRLFDTVGRSEVQA